MFGAPVQGSGDSADSIERGDDLRGFLQTLRRRGEPMVRFTREVQREHELAAVVKLLERHGDPVVCFERVAGSDMPVVVGAHGSRSRIAAALGCTVETAVEEFLRRIAHPLAPVEVEGGPVKDVRLTGTQIDLSHLPIVTHAEHDAGPFITAGVGLARDPATGAVNAGIYRMMVKGRDKLVVTNYSDLRTLAERAEGAERPLELVVSIGHHPAVQIASQAKLPLDVDSLAVAGALLGTPLEVTAAETVDAMVPARAEIVLEGRLVPGARELDGAFGESPRYYQADAGFVFQVTAVTHRRDAMFLDINNVHGEHTTLSVFPAREAQLLQTLRCAFPAAKAVHIPHRSAAMCAYISIDQHHDGEAKQVILFALGNFPRLKQVIVVDADVDVSDHEEVVWATITRSQWDRDLIVVPYTRGTSMDPSSYTLLDRHPSREIYDPAGLTTQVGIDATRPVDAPFAERADTIPARFAELNVIDDTEPW